MAQGKKTKFFVVSENVTKNYTGIIIENEEDLKIEKIIPFMNIDTRIRGFSNLNDKKVKLRYDRRKGRLPKDLEIVRGCWLITDRLKILLDAFASSSVSFRECELEKQDEIADRRFWLCDVTRIVDAIDEERSILTKHTYPDQNRIMFTLPSLGKIVIREEAVGVHEIFRLHRSEHNVICSLNLRTIIKKNQFQGLSFTRTESY